MPSINQPGVNTTVNFTTSSSLTISEPDLTPCLIGPVYQMESEGLASGTFSGKDNGDQEFGMPNYVSGNLVDSSSVKVFITPNGGSKKELRNSSSEVVRYTGSSTGQFLVYDSGGTPNATITIKDSSFSSWATTANVLTPSASSNEQVIRFTFRGKVFDLRIREIVSADILKLDLPTLDGALHPIAANATDLIALNNSIAYSVIELPKQYDIKTTKTQNTAVFGSSADFITFTGLGDFEFGENKKVEFIDQAILKEANGGFFGKAVARDSSGIFTNDANGVGSSSENLFVNVNASAGTAAGNGITPLGMTRISNNVVGLSAAASDAGGTNNQKFAILKPAVSGLSANPTGAANGSNDGDDTITFGGTPFTQGKVYYVALSGSNVSGSSSVLHKATADGSTSVLTFEKGNVLSGTDHNNTTVTAVHEQLVLAGGTTGTLVDTAFASASLIGEAVTTDMSIDRVDSAHTAQAVSSVANLADGFVVLSSGITAGSNKAFHLNPTAASSSVVVDGTTIKISLKYAAGQPSTTISDINTAVGAANSTSISSAVTGAGSVAVGFEHTGPSNALEFDGGGAAGSVVIRQRILHTGTGALPEFFGSDGYAVNISYRALRVDYTSDTKSVNNDPNSTTYYQTVLGAPSTQNPLSLAASLSLQNMGDQSLQVIGVNATSTDQPLGTTAAYSAALNVLEGKAVYALAPLSQDLDVTTAVANHVSTMSSSANKAERIAFINRAFPSYGISSRIVTTAAFAAVPSSNDGSTWTIVTNLDFSLVTNMPSSTDLANGTKDAILTVTSINTSSVNNSSQVFGASSKIYGLKIKGYSTTTVTLEAVPTGKTSVWNALSSTSAFEVYIPGAAISEKSDQAAAIAAMGSQYNNRRIFLTYPASIEANVSANLLGSQASNTAIEGYYGAAALVGMVAGQPVGQGFTNLSISGITKVSKSSDYFTRSQLNEIAGGGTFILFQEGITSTSPVLVRHQLATDVSTIEKRELSITKAIDFLTKTLRNTLKPTIGVFNITDALLDTISLSCQSVLLRMISLGIIASGKVSSIAVNSSAADTVDVTIQVAPLFPCNYIEITIEI